jgi:hypothetical protein
MKLRIFLSTGIGLLFLAACSLAADVTPPPGMQGVQVQNSQADTASESQVTPEPAEATKPAEGEAERSQDLSVESVQVITDTLGIEVLEPTGVISGTVTNASGGVIPNGLDVLLHGFDEMQMVLSDTVSLGEGGVFVFDQVPLKPGRAFIASLDFEGISYASNVAVAEEGMTSLQLPMEVFESTSDPAGLTIDRLHVFFEAVDENTLRVIELYVITNPGNQAVVASSQDQPPLNIALPPNASSLEFREGEFGARFVPTQDGFGDLAVIRPGIASHQVVFTYELPFNRKLAFEHRVHLPVNAVVVLVPEDSLKVKGDNLKDAGTRTSEGFIYRTYNGSDLASGSQLKMEVSQRSKFSRPALSSGSTQGVVVGMAVLALTLIAAGIWSYRRSRKALSGEVVKVNQPVPAAEDTQDSLMDAILALDDQYKAGKIPEGAYLDRRAELKERLSSLMQEKS